MIFRDEQNNVIGAENIKDILDELKDIENTLIFISENRSCNINENEYLHKISQIEPLIKAVDKDMQTKAGPLYMIKLLKQVARIKELTEKIKND